MRLLALYLIGYFALVAGAVATLWTSGILVRLPVPWLAAGIGAAVAIGVLLLLVTRRPRHRSVGQQSPPEPRARERR